MFKRIFLFSLLFTLLINLTACGFQLQTKDNLPPQLKTMYLTGDQPYTQFMRSLRENLIDRGIKLVNSQQQAPYTLNVTNTSLTTTQTSLSTSQQTRQYSVVYAANFVLQTAQGKQVISPFKLSASTTQTMFSGQLITNSSQLQITEQQLQRQVINKLFFVLGATDTSQAIQQFEKNRKSH